MLPVSTPRAMRSLHSPHRIRGNNVVATSAIENLSDDLLGAILFSNYLSSAWYDVLCVLLVSKSFLSLGKAYISHIDYSRFLMRSDMPFNSSIAPTMRFLCLPYRQKGIVCAYLDEIKAPLRRSLIGLNLRGCPTDVAVLKRVAKFQHLRFLDLSKSHTDRDLSDESCTALSATLHSLRWLDVSFTAVSDEGLRLLCSANPSLTHLALQCCHLLTDAACEGFRGLKIETLDISGCQLLTIASIKILCDPLNAISSHLTTLSMSFLPLVHCHLALTMLMDLPALTQLECRNKYATSAVPDENAMAQLSEDFIQKTYSRFSPCVLKHADQLQFVHRCSMINPSPRLTQLCPTFGLPYRSDDTL